MTLLLGLEAPLPAIAVWDSEASHQPCLDGVARALDQLEGVKTFRRALGASLAVQKLAFNETRNDLDSIGWKWMSATPAAGSPGRREP